MSNRSISSNIKRQIGLCSIELHKPDTELSLTVIVPFISSYYPHMKSGICECKLYILLLNKMPIIQNTGDANESGFFHHAASPSWLGHE